MNNSQLINQDSGNVEHYTPSQIMAVVHEMLPIIHLDPASCRTANETVRALKIYTKEIDGLTKQWKAKTLWMNHPFSKGEKACKPNCKKKACKDPLYKKFRGHCITKDIPSNLDWVNYLLCQHEKGNIGESLNITFCNSSETFCQKLLRAGPTCFIGGRVNFNDQFGNKTDAAPKGCMITYIGPRTEEFKAIFSKIGVVK